MMNDDEHLAHYGVIGMKWGVRKDGKPQGFQYGRSSNKKKKTSSPVKRFVKDRVTKISSDVSKRITDNRNEKLKSQQLGMDRKDYRKLRETTLRSNDPNTVVKGMQTLSDKELNDKINRLSKEKKMRDLASDVNIKEANTKKAQEEAYKAKKERRASGLGAKTISSVVNTGLSIGKQYVLAKLGLADIPSSKNSSKSDTPKIDKPKSADSDSRDSGASSKKSKKEEPASYDYSTSNPNYTAAVTFSEENVARGRKAAEDLGIIEVKAIDFSSKLSEERKKK
jgi:hypothetical protein